MAKGKNQTTNLLIAGVVIIVILLVLANPINLPASSIQNYYTNTNPTTNTGQPQQTATPQSNSLAPTSLTVQVSPNPVVVRHAIYGSVTSNGYNIPVTITVRHTGAEEWTNTGTQTLNAFLGADGKYDHVQQLNVPGFWEIWASSNGVTSNTATLTCTGALVTADQDTVTASDSYINFVVFSSYKNVAVSLFANDPAHSMSIPLQSVNTDDNGAVGVGYNFSGFAAGSYEVDAMVGGVLASSFGGSYWITVV